MRHGNASWINETRKKAKCNDTCQFWMTLVYILGLKICYVQCSFYDYSSFDFGLETELDLYNSVVKFRKLRSAKASAYSEQYLLSHECEKVLKVKYVAPPSHTQTHLD